MRITSKGQVTIPVAIREQAGLLPDTEVTFELEGNVVSIRKAKSAKGRGRGAKIVAHLRRMRTRPHIDLTTDQIMALMRAP